MYNVYFRIPGFSITECNILFGNLGEIENAYEKIKKAFNISDDSIYFLDTTIGEFVYKLPRILVQFTYIDEEYTRQIHEKITDVCSILQKVFPPEAKLTIEWN